MGIRVFFALFWLFCPPSFAHQGSEEAPPIIIQAITKMIPRLNNALFELERGDLLVLDLDNTVFREVQTLGTDEWYSHQLHKMISRGMNRNEAARHLESINNAIKTESKMRLMEASLPEVIARLQMKGVFVIGLTARHPALADTTIEHLAELGIHFRRSEFPEHGLHIERIPGLEAHAFLWRAGVAFTDGSPKGSVLKALIERAGVWPKKFIAVDDRIHHVHNLVEALLDLKIPGRVIHYLRVREEPPFDPRIADLQFRAFRRLGRLVSDEEARTRLGLMPDRCEESLKSGSK